MTKVLLLYDEITPAGAKEFVREITKLSPTAEVTIAINSPGGSVPAGDAIAAAIDRHKGTTTCRIDGVAASAASYIAMFADRVIMSKGSFIMIHEPYATMVGGAAELENAAKVLRGISARYATAYAARSGQDEATVRGWMTAETWFGAAAAVEAGFADEIDAALARAKAVSRAVLQYTRIPSEVRAMAAGATGGRTQAQRDRLRRRLMLIAQQVRSGRDPRRDEEDRARGERMRRRYEMQATLEAIRADDRKADAAERAANVERQRREYFYNWHGTPRGQRK